MAVFVDQRLGSGNFTGGAGDGTGQLLFYVTGVASQDEAVDAALADPAVQPNINGYLLETWDGKHIGGDLYHVDIQYKRSIPSQADAGAGQSPSGQQTPGQDPNSQLGRDVSFSTGGATKKIYVSRNTRYKVGRNAGTAPDFKKLIGVDIDGGKVEGCEVLSAEADFTVTKRFQLLTVGWWRSMLSTVACTNDAPYLGLDIGEVLFKGCDGQYKDDDKATEKTGYPWTVTGRFGFKPNKTFEEHPDDLTLGDIEIPEVRGWNYVWVIYQKEKETVTVSGTARDYIVQRPLFAYVEEVYAPKDLTVLNLN